MVVKVVDASALSALLFGEPEAETIAGRLGGARLVAPALLAFEVANTCLKKARRHEAQRDALLAAFRLRLAIEDVAVSHDAALELALATGLTAYDASYLWLARQLGAELVTLDRKLAQVAATR